MAKVILQGEQGNSKDHGHLRTAHRVTVICGAVSSIFKNVISSLPTTLSPLARNPTGTVGSGTPVAFPT